MIDDLKALSDTLNMYNVTLVGSSMGGGIAIDFTLTYPHLVKALILVSPSINGNSRQPIKLIGDLLFFIELSCSVNVIDIPM